MSHGRGHSREPNLPPHARRSFLPHEPKEPPQEDRPPLLPARQEAAPAASFFSGRNNRPLRRGFQKDSALGRRPYRIACISLEGNRVIVMHHLHSCRRTSSGSKTLLKFTTGTMLAAVISAYSGWMANGNKKVIPLRVIHFEQENETGILYLAPPAIPSVFLSSVVPIEDIRTLQSVFLFFFKDTDRIKVLIRLFSARIKNLQIMHLFTSASPPVLSVLTIRKGCIV